MKRQTPCLLIVLLISCAALFSGCQSYRTPGAGADIAGLFDESELKTNNLVAGPFEGDDSVKRNQTADDQDIQKIIRRRPASPLPANLVVLRLQDKDYWSYSCQEQYHRRGAYTIISARDIEEEKDFQRIQQLSQIAQVGTVNRLLLPQTIQSEKDLRLAAAKLHADMLFIYTVDTKYWSEDNARPLSVITLGLAPSVNLHMNSTLSGVLYDVRTGYVYGTVESTEKQKQLTSWWANSDTADQARLRTERKAFEKMIDEFEKLWIGVAAERMVVLNMKQ